MTTALWTAFSGSVPQENTPWLWTSTPGMDMGSLP